MDIALIYDGPAGGFDLSFAAPDMTTDEGMDTAIAISLFSDARARPDDTLPAAGQLRRGWWGDGLSDIDEDRIGSRMWLLAREKQTTELLNRTREAMSEALGWLVEDGVARSVNVATDWVDWTTAFPATDRVMVGGHPVRAGMLGITVTITRPDNSEFSRRYDHVWQTIGG